MIKDKKACKIISRVTAPQAFHLLRRTRNEGKTQSDIIRELIENDRLVSGTENDVKPSGLSIKSIHEKKRITQQKSTKGL